MDKSIFGLMDLLNLMPANTCAAICKGEQWIIEACNQSFRFLAQRFSNTTNFFESSDQISPGKQHSFLELLRQNGGEALVDRVCASPPEARMGIILASGSWTLGWKWLGAAHAGHGPDRRRFVLLHEVHPAEETTDLHLINQELHAIMDSMHDGLWIIDGNGTTLHVNKALKRIANIEPEEMIGKPVSIPLLEGKFSAAVTLEALEQRKIITRFDDYPNGTRCLNTSTPIFDKKGNIWRVVACIRDITELENLQKRLADAERTAFLRQTEGQASPQNCEKTLIATSKVMRR